MGRKTKPEPVRRMTQQEYVASLAPGTLPEDWEPVLKGSRAYNKGFRWRNRMTDQYARKVQ